MKASEAARIPKLLADRQPPVNYQDATVEGVRMLVIIGKDVDTVIRFKSSGSVDMPQICTYTDVAESAAYADQKLSKQRASGRQNTTGEGNEWPRDWKLDRAKAAGKIWYAEHQTSQPPKPICGSTPEVSLSVVTPIVEELRKAHEEYILSVQTSYAKAIQRTAEALSRQNGDELGVAPSGEMVQLLESSYKELDHKYRAAEAGKASLALLLEVAELETLERDDQIKQLRYQENEQRVDALAQREMRFAVEKQLEKFEQLDEWPKSIPECCRFFSAAFPERVAFTQQALDAAGRSDFPKVSAVWRALWHMANTLHSLVFDAEKQIDVEDVFRARSGIEMSLKEGKQTNNDPKLMRLRQRQYKGESIDITPHIKLQTGQKHFRFYFNIYRKERILVIGDCGHLDTAGTHKRK